jgi:CBS domain containing-hemolysin-like protein
MPNSLSVSPLPADAIVDHGDRAVPGRVRRSDPALDVMTDLTRIQPVVIAPTATIAVANERMIAAGVRLLFVVAGDGRLLGLITATDILGEKPLRYLSEHGGTHEQILAQDVMTPRDRLETLAMADVARATVDELVDTMARVGRQHMLVVETDSATGTARVRGLFSTTQIGRQLGEVLGPYTRAVSFAELESAIAGSNGG